MFLAGLDRIKSETENEAEANRLTAALVAASFNKPEVRERLREDESMNDLVRQNLAAFAAHYNNDAAKEALLLAVEQMQDAPLNLVELVENADLRDVPSLIKIIKHARATDDWTEAAAFAAREAKRSL